MKSISLLSLACLFISSLSHAAPPPARPASACESLVGRYSNPELALTISYDPRNSLILFEYRSTASTSEWTISIIADNKKHSGDGRSNGNSYIAECQTGILTVDENYDMGDLKKFWKLEGDTLVESGSLNGSEPLIMGKLKKLP